MDTKRFATRSLTDERLLRILAAALEAVDPAEAVRRSLQAQPLPHAAHTYGLALGKAAVPMLQALSLAVPLAGALAITKHAPAADRHAFSILEGGHPVPDERSLHCGTAASEFVSRLNSNDLLVCLISGGGSALMAAPLIPLEQLRELTNELLRGGARIDEINLLRRRLDRLKGGGVLRLAGGARVVSLILSDVVGDALEAIASGPTAPDPAGREDALRVLEKYAANPERYVPAMQEPLRPGDPLFERVENRIIASNRLAAEAAEVQAHLEGFEASILTVTLQGEARQVGEQMVRRLRTLAEGAKGPVCLIAGGETTVTVRGSGKGGRNQELALGAVEAMSGLRGSMLISLATDGEDGSTGAAGAVITGRSAREAQALGLDVAASLRQNDSYSFFERLGDLIRTGPTGTNVNDLIILAAGL